MKKIIMKRCGLRWQAKFKGDDWVQYDDTYFGAVGLVVVAHAKQLGIKIEKAKPMKDPCTLLKRAGGH